MEFALGRISFLFCAVWITVCCADEMSVQVFPHRPINYVSDKFISFTMSPADLVDIYKNHRDAFALKMRDMGSAHLKISGDSLSQSEYKNHLKEMLSMTMDLGDWLYETTKSNDLKLVVPMPYDPKKWNPRNVIKMLSKLKIDMDNVIWQLGSDFHATDAMKYIDDLSTLRTIVDAFTSMNRNQSWTVVGSDLTVGSNENEARLYSELSQHIVSAVGWSQSMDSLYPMERTENVFEPLHIDRALRTILNSRMPVWLTLPHVNQQSGASEGNCQMSCLAKGLKWAQTLGDASQNGFKMVYAPIDSNEWFKPSLTYYTTLLHKRLMGETVLDPTIMNGKRYNTHVYSHCTRNESNAMTMYGVNMADVATKVLAKVPLMRAGTEYLEYLLTVNTANGKVQLNGNDIVQGQPLVPTLKFHIKRFQMPAVLSMPAHSVGFWVFPNVALPECEQPHHDEQTRYAQSGKTSSEQLLQELIREKIQRDDEPKTNSIERSKTTRRERRSIQNTIEKEHKLNAIKKNVNGDENEIHRRDRRSIDDNIGAARNRRAGNLMHFIYSEMDSMKRRQLHSPLATKVAAAIAPKRSKRHINALSRLLDKFDFKKPTFNFKPSSFKLGSAAIPPITAVHDIYSVNSAERKVFNSVENPDLPAGDVHFDVEELANGAPNTNPAVAGYNGAAEFAARNPEIQETPIMNVPIVAPEDMNVQGPPEMYYESLFGDAPLPQTPPPPPPPPPPSQQYNVPIAAVVDPQQQRSFDELWEIDAAQFPSMPSLAPKQSAQAPEAMNTNIDFVVKELQPTWQKNQENLQKARNTLEKFYPPSLGGSKISSLLPNVARPQNIRSPFFDSAERRFFETRRRRRRSIDADMNDDIEKRVQEMAAKRPQSEESGEYNDLDDAIGKLSILDRALKIVADMDLKRNPKQETDFAKISADLKKLGEIVAQNLGSIATATPPPAPSAANDDNLQKRCKILSKSLEQRCLQEPAMPLMAFLKRESEDKAKKPTGPIKKLLAKVKENQRHKRSIGESYEILTNEIRLNEIPREIFGETKPIEIPFAKIPYVRREEKPVHEQMYDSAKDHVPKFLRVVKTTVNNLMDSMTRHVAGIWHSLS